MFTTSLKKKPNQLDDVIATLLERLNTITDPTEYAHVTDQLVKLYKLRDDTSSKKRVSPDALIGAAASLASVVIIVAYEHAHPLMSKALGFSPKPR